MSAHAEITVVPVTSEPDIERILAEERAETERVFGAQARLYSAVLNALAEGSTAIERPADDTYTCELCLEEISPASPLTATWIERRMRNAAFDWHPAGVDYVTAACESCSDDVLVAVAARGAEQAEQAAAEWQSLSDRDVVTYVHGSVAWTSDDAS